MTNAHAAPQTTSYDSAAARFNMIEGQLRPNGIRDERVLGAMENLPRHAFVPPNMAGYCCVDEELKVLSGRWLLRPLVTARLVQNAAVEATDTVLDIAGATGYSAAILSGMAHKVIALEDDEALAQGARLTLESLACSNVEVVVGKRNEGWKSAAPYNVIIINGAVEVIPAALIEQLAEGGRIVTVFRSYGTAHAAHISEIRVYHKIRGELAFRSIIDATANLLPDFIEPKTFIFG